ncbi:MAG: DNA recombination protein RmuC [Schleiferiaceae bacterium]|nr:DNA recombination protein RmuC [Schleiferiaceae bacterium]
MSEIDLLPLLGALWLGLILGASLMHWRDQKRRRQGRRDQALLEQQRQAYAQAQEELEALRQELRQTDRELSRLQTEKQHLEKQLREDEAKRTKEQEQLLHQFQNLSNRLLEQQGEKLDQRQSKNLENLLKPLRERLSEFKKKVEESDLAGAQRNAALKEQLENLRQLNQQVTEDARSLSQALRGDQKQQGQWGEMQLEKLLEAAGLEKNLHYEKEAAHTAAGGQQLRPDYIIHLPGEQHLILDSKVSLTAYLQYSEAPDAESQKRYLKAHLRSLQQHINELSRRDYPQLYAQGSPDYVLLFVANESALTLGLREDPELYEKALRKQVVLVSAGTLLATLRTVSYLWKQEAQNQNARAIADRASKLYDKFVNFTGDLRQVGQRLDQAQKSYDGALKKLHDGPGNLVRQTEQLRELGVNPTKNQDPDLLRRAGETDKDKPPEDEKP